MKSRDYLKFDQNLAYIFLFFSILKYNKEIKIFTMNEQNYN
jgi:hypothetical protein